MPIPRYIEIVNVSNQIVTVRDRGLAASGGQIDIHPHQPGDPLATLPRDVWHRKFRRYAGVLLERDKAERLGLLAEPASAPKTKKRGTKDED